MLDASDVQNGVHAIQGQVEVLIIPGVAAEDLRPHPVEPRGVGAIRANEAADSVFFGQQKLQQLAPEEARGARQEDSHAAGAVFVCLTLSGLLGIPGGLLLFVLSGRLLLLLVSSRRLPRKQLHDDSPVDIVPYEVPDLSLLAFLYVS